MDRYSIALGKKFHGLPCQGADGPCSNNNAIRYHQGTFYSDEESNFVTLCPECKKINDERIKELWNEYYHSRF